MPETLEIVWTGSTLGSTPDLYAHLRAKLSGGSILGCIASQPLLACFHEVLRPFVVDALRDTFTTTQLSNAVFATKAAFGPKNSADGQSYL